MLGAPDGGARMVRQAPPPGRPGAARAGGPAVYRLRPVDLAQYPPQTVGLLLQRWAGFWAGARPPLRLVVHSTPFRAERVVEGDARGQPGRPRGLAGLRPGRLRALPGTVDA